jgi:mono/diheme cytochrome c family protein
VVLTAGWQPVRIRARNMMVWTFGMRLWLVLAIATLLPPASFAAETPAAHGAYLATTIMACNNCHTPRGPNADLAFSGGQTFDTPDYTVVASNITPDVKTGIGGWSDAQLEKTLRTGVRPDGVALAPVMPSGYYGIISDADMAAIIAYLRTIPAIERQVPAPIYRKAEPIEIFPGAEGAAAAISPPSATAWNATCRSMPATMISIAPAPAASCSAAPGAWSLPPTSPPTPTRASANGPIRRSSAPSPKASPVTAANSSPRWPTPTTRA